MLTLFKLFSMHIKNGILIGENDFFFFLKKKSVRGHQCIRMDMNCAHTF